MYVEATIIISEWLRNETYGINAMLESLLLEEGDEAPPAVADIVDEETHPEVIERKEPQNSPAVYVMLDDPIVIDPVIGTGIKQKITDLPIALRYITKNTDPVSRRRETMYTLRAIKKSLYLLDQNVNVSLRTRNSLYLNGATSIIIMEIKEDVGDAVASGAIVVVYEAYDTDP